MNNHSTPPQQRHGHAVSAAASSGPPSSSSSGHHHHHAALHPPFISNSLAIRQEIQRFESVHPSIYAIYDLIDLLPDAQIAQQIRDHVVCIEAIQARSLSSSGKDALENFINKLPCGWPEAGIPPLAPYTKENIEFVFKKSFAEILAKFEHFRIDGLDILLINELKISYAFRKKIKFNLVLPRVVISGRLVAGAIVDFMEEYGISLKYDGNGDLELILENITFDGHFKYTMPYIFGSIKIYNFDGSLTLGNVISEINGIAGEGKYKQLLNDQIEDILMKTVSIYQDKINGMLIDDLVPYLNSKLKGRKIWSLIASAFGKKGKICYPPADPWASN